MAIVEIVSGKVEGFEKRGVLQFRGIPYAAPPVGDLRWRPPAPVEPWAGTREAKAYGPVAPQSASPFHVALGAEGPPSDEAGCLTLNVWTPALDDARRPVMVWLHGGSYVIGDGRTPWYDGVHYARDRDVVVVTCNYRLGALGYLHLADTPGGAELEGSGNCGLLDQVAVLRWVAGNIAAFGGDPANVTIFGESAGAMSTSTLLGTPGAAGLFHRAIPQSGALAHVHPDRDAAGRVARDFLGVLGLEKVDAADLQAIPAETILDAQDTLVERQFGGSGEGIGIIFEPVVDGAALPLHPLDTVRAGGAAGVPLLTGVTSEEMKLFITFATELDEMDDDTLVNRASAALAPGLSGVLDAYRERLGDVSRIELWSAVLTDRVFRWPCIQLVEAQQAHQPATFAYEFAYRSPAMGGLLGASHAVDIPFTFDNLTAPGAAFFVGEATEAMGTLARACGDAWTSFARHAEPRADGLPAWPAWSPDRRATMVLDLDPHLADDPWAFTREVWSGVET